MVRQVRSQQVEHFLLGVLRAVLGEQDGGFAAAGEEPLLLVQLFGEPRVGLDPVGKVERLQADAEGPGRAVIGRVGKGRTGGGGAIPPPAVEVVHASSRSSSSMKPAMTDRPLRQKAGSVASRPNGASSSEWCLVPPADSMAKYFSWKPASASS